MSSASTPPTRKKSNAVAPYRSPIRLWSTVVNHATRPCFASGRTKSHERLSDRGASAAVNATRGTEDDELTAGPPQPPPAAPGPSQARKTRGRRAGFANRARGSYHIVLRDNFRNASRRLPPGPYRFREPSGPLTPLASAASMTSSHALPTRTADEGRLRSARRIPLRPPEVPRLQ